MLLISPSQPSLRHWWTHDPLCSSVFHAPLHSILPSSSTNIYLTLPYPKHFPLTVPFTPKLSKGIMLLTNVTSSHTHTHLLTCSYLTSWTLEISLSKLPVTPVLSPMKWPKSCSEVPLCTHPRFLLPECYLEVRLVFNGKSFAMSQWTSANHNRRKIMRESSKLCFPINDVSVSIPSANTKGLRFQSLWGCGTQTSSPSLQGRHFRQTLLLAKLLVTWQVMVDVSWERNDLL